MTRDTKDTIQYGSAIGMLASGVILTFLSFFLNGYDVADGVLWYVGQCLVYAGSIFGVTVYINTKFNSLASKGKDKAEQ